MNETTKETIVTFDGLANLARSVERELQAVASATRAMQTVSQQLGALPDDIHTTITETTATTVKTEAKTAFAAFDDATKTAKVLKTELLQVRQSLYVRFALWVFVILVCCAAVVWLATAFFVPSASRIQSAIDTKAALEKQIEDLNSTIAGLSRDEQVKRAEVAALTKKINKWNASSPRSNATVIPCSDENDNARWCVLADAIGAPVKLQGYEKQYYWLQ